MKLSKRKNIFMIYTLLFIFLCLIVFYPFYSNHRSLIWGISGQDGISQHLASVTYFGEYIRTVFLNFIHGKFYLPMWDNSIGYGSDIISTLNYYAIGDPINLIYAFSNKYNAEYFYDFMLIFRAYLAGISFIIFEYYFKKNPHGIIIGSLTYVFSGVFLNLGVRHPFFLNPMIYLPLLILGVEKIYRKERPYLFMIIVAISAISNFYFFYMLTMAAVVYALIRFPRYKKDGFFRTIFRFSGWYVIGVGLSMIILLPVLIAFSGNARSVSTSNYFSIFFYQIYYYKALIQQSIAFQPGGRAANLNFIALAYCACIALFLKKSKKRTPYQLALSICIICILSPIFGYIWHAFTYPMNRWSFIIAFVVGSVLTEMYEDLLDLTKLQKVGICIGLIFYFIVYRLTSAGSADIKLAFILLVLTTIGLIINNQIPFLSNNQTRHFLMYGLTIASICLSGFGHYSLKMNKVLFDYVPEGKAYNVLSKKERNILKEINFKNNKLDRVESSNSKIPNWGMIDHIPNTTSYFSITDKNVSDTLMDFGLNQYQYKFKFKKLDSRDGLLNLYHVKYLIANDTNKKGVPKDYKLIKTNQNSKIYENKNLLPFGYTYDSCITEEEYKKLNSAQKECSMLQNAVISNSDDVDVRKSVYTDNTKTIDIGKNYKFIKAKNGVHKVHIKISARDIGKNSYLYLQGVRFTPLSSGRKHVLLEGVNSTRFVVDISDHKYTLCNAEAGAIYDIGKRNYLVHIDTSNMKGKNYVDLTLIFPKANKYTIGKISIIKIDQKKENENLDKLKKAPHLTNITYDGANHFSGKISTNENRILCIPFVYNKGWKATDNGTPVKLLKVNGMFCGMSLKAGNHNIKLEYTTPGLKLGTCISFISFIGILIYSVIFPYIHRKKDENKF